MRLIFRWNGDFVGFFAGRHFFDPNARYLGWLDEAGTVWDRGGEALGELVDEHYVLRNTHWPRPVRRCPPVPPVPPTPPFAPAPRAPRAPRPGWVDALAELGRLPSGEELVGTWARDQERVRIEEDGTLEWSLPGQPSARGAWSLRGQLLLVQWATDASGPEQVIFRVIEFTGETLTLRQQVPAEPSLPFTLERSAPPAET